MKVISIPARLRLSTSLLFLSIPIAALQTIVVTHSPWWHLPYGLIRGWCLAVALIVLPVVAWLQAGVRSVYIFFVAFASVWVALSAWTAIRLEQPAQGFFTLFLLVFFGSILAWIRHELGRSFFDPQISWYEGFPRPIPGLHCHLGEDSKTPALRVSRLDREGVFVYSQEVESLKIGEAKMSVTLRFRDRSLKTDAFPIRILRQDRGAGLQFRHLNPDQRKELGDFVEMLRGEGYVE